MTSSAQQPAPRIQFCTRKALIRIIALLIVLGLITIGCGIFMVHMPGETYDGAFVPLSAAEEDLKADLHRDLAYLGETIGNRNLAARDELQQAADWLAAEFAAAGYEVQHQAYDVSGIEVENLSVELRGTTKPEEIIVVGGHYDSVAGCPGANDNGTGTVATLALARAFAGKNLDRTVRFVAFVNEEPPYFCQESMGSLDYARACHARGDNVIAMLSLETIGYYSDVPGNQRYPSPFNLVYPDTGNFVAVVGNTKSRSLVRRVVREFRAQNNFPCEGIATFGFLPGIGWSDHWAFWQVGYPAIMLTDTAPFRYPHYHTREDTPDKVDYDRFARVIANLIPVITALATE